MSDVLVAAGDLTPGAQLTPASVRWEQWPRTSVDPSYITRATAPDPAKFTQGAVVRTHMVAGEPMTPTKIAHADSAGFLASMLTPGMRAVSIVVSADTSAGGFILPDDRVDVLCTVSLPGSGANRFRTSTILKDVRVLAVDQTYESKDSKTVVGRTATLELSPQQVELVEHARASGTLSLALRPLGEKETASTETKQQNSAGDEIDIIRYGVERPTAVGAAADRKE
jgi:pilus assembly protein CpaB